ncbi:Increased rDNA silencing protein [Lambiella insularis]|nr:Increased rDNA silencing protein [Lambiella insularis]
MISSTFPTAQPTNRRTSSNINDSHGKAQNPALRGASLAFRTPPPPTKPLINTYSGSNGALAAATKAGIGLPMNNVRTAVATFQFQTLHASNELARAPVRPDVLKRATSDSVDTLKTWSIENSGLQQSPSHIAAVLAAARSSGQNLGTSAGGQHRARGQSASTHDRKDETSIPATNALVKLFESRYGSKSKEIPKRTTKGETDKAPILPSRNQQTRHIVSPTPIRPPIPLRLSSQTLSGSTGSLLTGRPASNVDLGLKGSQQQHTVASMTGVQYSRYFPTTHDQLSTITRIPPAVPPPRRLRPSAIDLPQAQTIQISLDGLEDNSSTSSYTSARDMLSRTSTLETVPLPKPIKPFDHPEVLPFSASTPSSPVYKRPALPGRASSRSSTRYTTSRVIPQLTADSLADAMVASSLASSRAPSPSRPTPPFARRQSRQHHLFLPPHLASRTPSPAKTMRHTLRSASSPFDEDLPRKYHHYILKKHPNKHAEGDRKRWRDSITERERKRYEGVWAANKGLLLGREFQDYIHALVVKDIWSRSQLAATTLAEVWELVNGRGDAMLGKEEFVVGLWLVDQCLKGRKLPVKVGESVWESVRALSGVKIRSGKGRR